jgi:hypothetical protein
LAHVDSPKGDLNHDNTIENADASNIIVSSTVYPYGTTEMFPKVVDSAGTALDNSAHAYMECSNKGICDRTTGMCECFVGYDGSACQRASCPNDCSGHGTCESISKLASNEFSNVYALWDKDATMGCNCDAGYGAADCSTRECKYGVDPLYADDAHAKLYKASYQFVASTATDSDVTGTYAIRGYDIFGEDFVTGPIAMNAGCTTIMAALAGLPNDVIKAGDCTSTTGPYTVNLDFTAASNPGAHRPLEIDEYLDGSRKTVEATTGNTYALNQWTREIGENTDHFASKCAGVSVEVKLSATAANDGWSAAAGSDDAAPNPGSIGFISGTTSEIALLKACLGDSDGDSTNNVDVYNWDHGAVTEYSADGVVMMTMGSYPHAIKVQDDAGTSEYILVWWDTGRGAGFEMRTVNSAAVTDTTLDVYTTNGIVQMLGKDHTVSTDSDTLFSAGKNETKLTGYFSKYSNKIYTNYDGSCETTGDYYSSLHNCVEKGDLLFVVDGCWGAGSVADVGQIFGGTTINCAWGNVNSGTGMLYTVNKIYTQAWSANTTAFDSQGGVGFNGQEDRFVIEVNHNIGWDGSEIGNPDNSIVDAALAAPRPWGYGFTGLVVLFKFTPATDGSSYTYVSECSNRGSCDRETGICACFKGYTSDNCSVQSALAV